MLITNYNANLKRQLIHIKAIIGFIISFYTYPTLEVSAPLESLQLELCTCWLLLINVYCKFLSACRSLVFWIVISDLKVSWLQDLFSNFQQKCLFYSLLCITSTTELLLSFNENISAALHSSVSRDVSPVIADQRSPAPISITENKTTKHQLLAIAAWKLTLLQLKE